MSIQKPCLIFDPELWVDIQGYEGLYQISNHGRVKSLARWVAVNCEKNSPYQRFQQERILSASKGKQEKRYYVVLLCDGITRKTHAIHRLVCQHFIDNPDNKEQVNHIDGDRENNHVSNLEWCTLRENLQHARDIGLTDDRGEKHSCAKLKDTDVPDIKKMIEEGFSYRKIAQKYNVSITTIYRINKGTRYAA